MCSVSCTPPCGGGWGRARGRARQLQEVGTSVCLTSVNGAQCGAPGPLTLGVLVSRANDDLLKSVGPQVTVAVQLGHVPINTALRVFDKKSDDFLKNVRYILFYNRELPLPQSKS